METNASTNDVEPQDGTTVTASANGTSEAANTASLEADLAAANAKAEDNYNKFLYAMADFENYKKRAERSLGEIAGASRRAVLIKFLPVLDNLERALAHQDDAEGLRRGLQATLRGFEAVLSGEGVKPVSVKGTPFDPRVAEAIGTQTREGVEDDVVLEEAERGYTIGDELLRPAKVIVAKA